jgi:hypothetical protein
VTSDDASQLASPKIPRSGQGRWYMVGTVPTRFVSGPPSYRRTAWQERRAFYAVCAPYALTLNICCRRRASRSFHMQYSWRWLVSAKPSQIRAVHVFHLILNEGTWRGL